MNNPLTYLPISSVFTVFPKTPWYDPFSTHFPFWWKTWNKYNPVTTPVLPPWNTKLGKKQNSLSLTVFLSPCSRKRQVRNTGQPLTLLPSTSYTPDSPHSSSFFSQASDAENWKNAPLMGGGLFHRSPTDLKNPPLWGAACKELCYTPRATSRV